MHGFKVQWHLDPGFETRRLLWRMGHAHGALLSRVQLSFAVTIPHARPKNGKGLRLASALLLLAGFLLPLGFFPGGIRTYGGDPGPGILLSPIGAGCLLVAACRTAWPATFSDASSP